MEHIQEIISNCCDLTMEECAGNKHEPSFCHYCGKKRERESGSNPWLWKGCICEVWSDLTFSGNKILMYFCGFYGYIDEKPTFVRNYCDVPNKKDAINYNNYRITGTPLDFAPGWATHIEINNTGLFRFCLSYEDNDDYFFRTTNFSPWNNCPEHLKGKTLPIPDWARNGGTE